MPNILQLITERLGYPALQKVDPNTQESAVEQYHGNALGKLSQAAIPAIMIAITRYFRIDANSRNLTAAFSGNEWLQQLFGKKKEAVIQKIADFSGKDTAATTSEMERIATTAIEIIREKQPEPDTQKINNLLGSQNNNFLSHLPASLQLGQLMGDDTIDDRTNKMQGTVSSFLHKIGDAFSKPTKTKNWPPTPDTPHN